MRAHSCMWSVKSFWLQLILCGAWHRPCIPDTTNRSGNDGENKVCCQSSPCRLKSENTKNDHQYWPHTNMKKEVTENQPECILHPPALLSSSKGVDYSCIYYQVPSTLHLLNPWLDPVRIMKCAKTCSLGIAFSPQITKKGSPDAPRSYLLSMRGRTSQPPSLPTENLDQVCKGDKIFSLVELFFKDHRSYTSKPTSVVQDLGQNDSCVLYE